MSTRCGRGWTEYFRYPAEPPLPSGQRARPALGCAATHERTGGLVVGLVLGLVSGFGCRARVELPVASPVRRSAIGWRSSNVRMASAGAMILLEGAAGRAGAPAGRLRRAEGRIDCCGSGQRARGWDRPVGSDWPLHHPPPVFASFPRFAPSLPPASLPGPPSGSSCALGCSRPLASAAGRSGGAGCGAFSVTCLRSRPVWPGVNAR